MSATATLREPRCGQKGAHVGGLVPAGGPTLPERVRVMLHGLCGRFGATRLPAYVSAFETEHLTTLAVWSDCRTGVVPQPVDGQRYGGR